MFYTLISGISVLIFSTLAKTCMSYMLLKEMPDIPDEEKY